MTPKIAAHKAAKKSGSVKQERLEAGCLLAKNQLPDSVQYYQKRKPCGWHSGQIVSVKVKPFGKSKAIDVEISNVRWAE